MDPPLLRAFSVLVRSADAARADQVLRTAIGSLVSDFPEKRRPDIGIPPSVAPPRSAANSAAARLSKSRDLDTPVIDWAPLRVALHRIVSSSEPAQRVKIAAELGIAPSSLRNFISNAVPGQAVAARVRQWLENRQNDDLSRPTADVEAQAGAEASGDGMGEPPQHANGRAAPPRSNRQNARTLGFSHVTTNRDIGTNVPAPPKSMSESAAARNGNGTNLPLPTLTGEQAAGRLSAEMREKLAFMIEHDPKSVRTDAGVGLDIAREAIAGGEFTGEIIARLTRFLTG